MREAGLCLVWQFGGVAFAWEKLRGGCAGGRKIARVQPWLFTVTCSLALGGFAQGPSASFRETAIIELV